MSEERYEIRGKIGQGGVGAVYRAYDKNLNREVAIKRVLTEEGFDANDEEDGATKALLKEATALCSVQHPHIVTVYDAGVDSDGPYVVMELLSGRTLDEMVERGTMTWQDFRETAVQCLEALIAAQELDLVHRDIKPSNVMVTWLPSGKFQVKLVDFGLAKFSAKPSLQTIDHGDAVFGSIHFMAPEQFERVPLDQRTDMYSLGCVFFFCLTGEYPFDAETAPQVMAAHLQNDFHPLKDYRPDLPDWVCQWVEWHIARAPDDRPRNAREALERFLSFEQPVPQTAPVAVETVSASSLNAGSPRVSMGDSSHLTGPVPVQSGAREGATPVRAKLLTGPVLGSAAASETTDAQASGVPVVVPQPITPPGGAPTPITGAQTSRVITGPVSAITGQVSASIGAPSSQTGQILSSGLGGATSQAIPGKSAKGNSAVKIAAASVLGVAIVVTTVLLVDVMGTRDAEKELEGLMAQAADPTVTEIPLSEKNVESFLAAASSVDFDPEKGAVYQTLYLGRSTTNGFDLDKRVAEFASSTNLSEQIRTKLFEVVGKRGEESSMPFLLKYATDGEDNGSVVAALNATGQNVETDHLDVLYRIISTTDSPDVRSAAERAVKRHLEGKTNNSRVARDLLKAFENSLDSKPKETFLRLLGASGDPQAKGAVSAALASDENTLRVAAYAALANWRDTSLFETHLKALRGESDKFLRSYAFDSLVKFLVGKVDLVNYEKKAMWTAVSSELKDEREKKEFIGALGRGSEAWALELIRPFTKDSNEDLSFYAERAIEAIKGRR